MSLHSDLENIVQEYISDFIDKQNLPFVVKKDKNSTIPIVWFGDIKEYLKSHKKIVTVGLNPSFKEFEERRFDIVNLKSINAVGKLIKILNLYFKINPYKKWFNFFEKVLNYINTSYYENNAKNTAIHIDIYSAIATNPTWGKLTNNQKEDIQRTDLFEKLLKILNPDIIVFSTNQKVFNNIFSQFSFEKGNDNICGKKGFFIRKYTNDNKIIINGRNYRGQPFGGLKDEEIQKAMKDFL